MSHTFPTITFVNYIITLTDLLKQIHVQQYVESSRIAIESQFYKVMFPFKAATGRPWGGALDFINS